MTGVASGCLKMWACVILLLCCAGLSLSSSHGSVNPEAFDYGIPISATLTGTSSKLAPGAQHYVSAPPLPSYNGYAYRPLPQYSPSWSPYGYGFPPPYLNYPPHYGYRYPPPMQYGYGHPPPMQYGHFHGGHGGHYYGGHGGHNYGGHGVHNYGGHGGHNYGGHGGHNYGGHGGHNYGGHGGHGGHDGHNYGGHGGHNYGGHDDDSSQQELITSSRSGKLYAGRNNYGSGFISQHKPGSGHVSAPAQYSQHIQQVADYIPIANQISLAFDDPVTPYVGTHFTKAEPSSKYGMDMVAPPTGTAHLPSIYQPKKKTRRRRSLGSAGHGGRHPGYAAYPGHGVHPGHSVHPGHGVHPGHSVHPGPYGGYYGGQMYHPSWDTYYQRLTGYDAKLGYGNYNPYVFDYQTAASLDDPLLTASYPSSYYGYSMHQLPSLRPSNPFANQAPGLALNPHYQYSRAAYRNFLHESMDGVDPVEYVKQSV